MTAPSEYGEMLRLLRFQRLDSRNGGVESNESCQWLSEVADAFEALQKRVGELERERQRMTAAMVQMDVERDALERGLDWFRVNMAMPPSE